MYFSGTLILAILVRGLAIAKFNILKFNKLNACMLHVAKYLFLVKSLKLRYAKSLPTNNC